MPIKVACKCGQKFTAKDELAGRAVKCPKCKQPLKIPGGAKQPAPAAPKPQQPAPQGPAPMDLGGDMSSLLDEEMGDGSLEKNCPSCGRAFPVTSVVCLGCGYNRNLGGKVGGGFTEVTEASNAEDMVRRAQKEIEKNPIQTAGQNFGDIGNVGAWILPFFMPVFLIFSLAVTLYWGSQLYLYLGVLLGVIMAGKYEYCMTAICFLVSIICILYGWYSTSMRALELNVWIGLIIMSALGFLGIPFALFDWKESSSAGKAIVVGWWFFWLGVVIMMNINLLYMWSDLKNSQIETSAPFVSLACMWMYYIAMVLQSIALVWLSEASFRKGMLHGFLSFTGVYAVVVGFLHFKELVPPMVIWFVSLGIAFMSTVTLIIGMIASTHVLTPSGLSPYERPSTTSMRDAEPPLVKPEFEASAKINSGVRASGRLNGSLHPPVESWRIEEDAFERRRLVQTSQFSNAANG